MLCSQSCGCPSSSCSHVGDAQSDFAASLSCAAAGLDWFLRASMLEGERRKGEELNAPSKPSDCGEVSSQSKRPLSPRTPWKACYLGLAE